MRAGEVYPLARAARRLTKSLPPGFLQEKVARLLFKPEHQTGGGYVIAHRGIEWAGEFVDYIDWRIFFLGDFERESLNVCAFLSRHVDGAFVDISANKGLYSATLARDFPSVFAFEPDPRNLARLRDIVGRNGLQNVDIRGVALGDVAATATFNLPPESNQGTGSILPIAGSRGTITVPVSTGDAELAGEKVGLIKVDVEGFEAYALRGMRGILRRDRPFVLFEISESSRQPFIDSGGVMAVLPPDYTLFEVPERVAARLFALKPVAASKLLDRRITNNLACPAEKLALIEPFLI